MKAFTITTPNIKCDPKGEYKNYLLKRLVMAYPELTIDGIDTEESPFSYQYIGPNNKIRFGRDYFSRCDAAKYAKCRYCPFEREENYNMATQFELAMKRLDDYAKTQRDYAPVYDFRLEDGTPVREYANFIQVGYKLIPKNNFAGYYRSLPKEEKTVINNIIIMVNNSTEINAELNANLSL
jgi:hypothetical protein